MSMKVLRAKYMAARAVGGGPLAGTAAFERGRPAAEQAAQKDGVKANTSPTQPHQQSLTNPR